TMAAPFYGIPRAAATCAIVCGESMMIMCAASAPLTVITLRGTCWARPMSRVVHAGCVPSPGVMELSVIGLGARGGTNRHVVVLSVLFAFVSPRMLTKIAAWAAVNGDVRVPKRVAALPSSAASNPLCALVG